MMPRPGSDRVSLIVPAYDDAHFLRRTVPRFLKAVQFHGNAELVIVDNGSTTPLSDADLGRSEGFLVHRIAPSTIARARNEGVRAASGGILVFCDADILIPHDHLVAAASILHTAHTAATGSNPLPDASDNWIEHSWFRIHSTEAASSASQDIPSGNFAIVRDVFEGIGGFDEGLVTGEDSEICRRLRIAGYDVRSTPALNVVHLGNPRTIPDFVRRNIWHGLGMFGTTRLSWWDKPTLGLFAHLLFSAVGILASIAIGGFLGLGILMLSQAVIPVASMAYRARRARTITPVDLARVALLYWFYYWARGFALILVLSGRDAGYRSWASRRRSNQPATETP